MAAMDWSAQAGHSAAEYDDFLVPAMFTPFAESLLERAGVQPDSRVLDVACGTGAVARIAARLAGAGGAVTAIDLGEPTLAIARSRRSERGAAPIEYRRSDAEELPFAESIFDVAVCQQGLQFFPDRPRALAEMRRVLKAGGRLAIATWTDIAGSPLGAVADALARHVSTEAGAVMHSPFALHSGEDLHRLVAAAGFREIVVEAETKQCTWASHSDFALRAIAAGPIAPLLAAAPEDARHAVNQEVAERLAAHATADGCLRMSMTSNVLIARA
jgi:ubiquinone/menaquinone biosynthesis C-methylase UbiE